MGKRGWCDGERSEAMCSGARRTVHISSVTSFPCLSHSDSRERTTTGFDFIDSSCSNHDVMFIVLLKVYH